MYTTVDIVQSLATHELLLGRSLQLKTFANCYTMSNALARGHTEHKEILLRKKSCQASSGLDVDAISFIHQSANSIRYPQIFGRRPAK